MMPDLGQLMLAMALALSIVQIGYAFFICAYKDGYDYIVKLCMQLQFVAVLVAFLRLAYAFIINDFSLKYVASHSSHALPLIYRILALWSAHAGSLMLWVLILVFWGALFSLLARKIPRRIVTTTLGVLGIITALFLIYVLKFSDPFEQAKYLVVNGGGINPILYDIGLGIHPPLLYMGYVGFVVVFSLAVAILIHAKKNEHWFVYLKKWLLPPWIFLTLGIIFGSWWSYRELGWGGYWFWDPVENASLLPWLVATALLHTLKLVEKHSVCQSLALLLSLLIFSLSLIGTFLVRSGILVSIHAFSIDQQRGQFLLLMLSLIIGFGLTAFTLNVTKFSSKRLGWGLFTRESMLLINNVLLLVAAITIGLGTLYPMLVNLLSHKQISVGPPYFNWVLMPFAVLALLMMLLIPFIKGKSESNPARAVTLRALSLYLGHIGFIIMVLGISLNATLSVRDDFLVKLGQHEKIDRYEFDILGATKQVLPAFQEVRLAVKLKENHHLLAMLHPALKIFKSSSTAVSAPAIDVGWFRDIYLSITGIRHGELVLLFAVKAFVRWIWLGGVLMALAGLLLFCDGSRHKGR